MRLSSTRRECGFCPKLKSFQIRVTGFFIGCHETRECKVSYVHHLIYRMQTTHFMAKIALFLLHGESHSCVLILVTVVHACIFVDNWAFLYAQKLAMKMEVSLHVCFCLVPKFLDASYRHFSFMLKGLREVEKVRRHFLQIDGISNSVTCNVKLAPQRCKVLVHRTTETGNSSC